jgi:hypothetical protein
MEFLRLTPHPAIPAPPAIEVDAVALVLATDSLCFRYRVRGDIQRLRWPPTGPAQRTDELWRHTCFEAFLKPKGSDWYVELNFAPSSAWAAYSFESYRLGMQPLRGVGAPSIRCRTSATEFTLDVTVRMRSLRFDSAIGLAAVLEDQDGAVSYWALSHPRPKPDFHDAGGWQETFRRASAEERS